MSQDTLSDVLRTVRLRGAVFYYISAGEDWAAQAPAAQDIATAVMPGVEHVMEYHVMTKGTGWASIVGQPPVRLATGDIVLFPHGDPHVMASAPDIRPTQSDTEWFYATRHYRKPIPVSYHGFDAFSTEDPPPGALTNIVCGFLGCDVRPFNPLISTLPRLLHLPSAGNDEWVARCMQLAVDASQNKRPGSDVVLERMSEMMFVDAVRRYVESLPEASRGWLAGLRDRHVGRALTLLHADPARDWTIEALANEVALSRSALYDRFVQLIGQPPIQYLTQWRMQLAANLLRESHAPVASVALEVGYDSEAAFARAFKRITGTPPATWRRERQAARLTPR